MNEKSGDNHFAFLSQARPANLYKVLRKAGEGEAAMALAHLPPILTAQVMAYYPEEQQAGLMALMRSARRAEPAAVEAAAGKVMQVLAAMKAEAPPAPPETAKPAPASTPPRSANPPLTPRGGAIASAYGKGAPGSDKPQPWKPRVADGTPINAPAKPGRPPAVSGPPSKSPLSKLNIFELLGFSKKDRNGDDPAPASAKPELPARPAVPPPSGKNRVPPRPPAREGTIGANRIRTSDKPRVLGIGKAPATPKRPAAPPAASAGGGRKMDGMAILAAILREAPMDVRQNVAEDSPALFRALKERMFVFDDLNFSDRDALAQVFTVAPIHVSALALRFAAPALRERALAAVSPRRAEMIRQEERSAQSGTAGLDAIETAQNQVLEVALRLQSAGRIVIDPRDPDLAG